MIIVGGSLYCLIVFMKIDVGVFIFLFGMVVGGCNFGNFIKLVFENVFLLLGICFNLFFVL